MDLSAYLELLKTADNRSLDELGTWENYPILLHANSSQVREDLLASGYTTSTQLHGYLEKLADVFVACREGAIGLPHFHALEDPLGLTTSQIADLRAHYERQLLYPMTLMMHAMDERSGALATLDIFQSVLLPKGYSGCVARPWSQFKLAIDLSKVVYF